MAITVVGIGADGWSGLDATQRDAVNGADVVVGGERHLAMLPEAVTAERRPWPSPLRDGLPALLDELKGRRVVGLSSGDPLVAGIATILIELGVEVTVLPAISSVVLARARMGWPAESVTVLRDHRDLPRHLAPENRVIVLSANADTPAQVARLLTDSGFGGSTMSVFENLGGDEKRTDADAESWHATVGNLNLIALDLWGDSPFASWTAGLPDHAFDHDGQLTKRDARASALARLAPAPDQMLWDVGAGAGSIGIEWLRAHPTCRAIAFEEREDRSKRIAENAVRLGVGRLRVVTGHAPEAFGHFREPDAIFVGGGATDVGVLDRCWETLAPGGRMVVHGVTLETERVLADKYAELGGELTRLHVEHAGPIGTFTGWKPARAIVQWTVRKAAAQQK
ncbi:MAG TPA: precorrin-6y C5,15-methyltransferase (decarboxylating) subunit CbiE [Aeromicrobium sp.]|nr:precorrin-6y C5,15-methyltransferase (decarboxylating) subunit CbiE [Aeromicrobium sp.]